MVVVGRKEQSVLTMLLNGRGVFFTRTHPLALLTNLSERAGPHHSSSSSSRAISIQWSWSGKTSDAELHT